MKTGLTVGALVVLVIAFIGGLIFCMDYSLDHAWKTWEIDPSGYRQLTTWGLDNPSIVAGIKVALADDGKITHDEYAAIKKCIDSDATVVARQRMIDALLKNAERE